MNRTILLRLTPFMVILKMALIATSVTVSAQTLKWGTKAATPVTGGTGRNSAMCFAINGKIYVGGGNTAELTNTNSFYEYDTATNVWTQKADLPSTPNRSAGVAFAIGGKGYVGLGIQDYFTGTSSLLNDLWEYDPATNTWTAKASLPDTGRGTAGLFVVNNKAYVIGGQTTISDSATADVWEYSPTTNAWTAKAPFPGGVITYPFAFSIGTKGYISCGSVGSGLSKKTYEFDPVANTWTAKADYPGSKSYAGVSFVINNKAYCGLAGTFSGATDTFYAYNPTSNSWSAALTNFPGSPRVYAVATQIGNKAYVGGGWIYNSSTATQTFYNDWYSVYDSSATVPSGVPEIVQNSNIRLFPNPSQGSVNIILSDPALVSGTFNVYNLLGQQVLATAWKNETAVDISALPAGQYIIELNAGRTVLHTRLFVAAQ